MPIISYTQDNCTFIHRVAAVIIDRQRVLLHKSELDEIWSLPGGHVEMMEDSLQAIQRELIEEVGETVAVERLLWIVENMFEDRSRRFHEMGLYYLVRLEEDSQFLAGDGSFFGSEDFEGDHPIRLTFRWFPLNAAVLENQPIYPIFLRKGLLNLPAFPEHVLNLGAAV